MPTIVYELGNSQLAAAARDIGSGLVRWRLWFALASEDINRRFKRTYIGVLWTTLSFALFVAVKVLIFSPMASAQADATYFTLYVAIGYFAWMYISTVITDGCNVFAVSEAWIKGGRLPFTLFVNVSIMRSLIFAFYNFLVVAGLMAIYHARPTLVAFWSLGVFGMFILNAFFIHFLLGVLCVRYRDLSHLIQAILRVMFFLTPIFWLPEQLGGLWTYLQFNPFAHYLIAFRDPLLAGTVPESSMWVIGITTGVLMVSAFTLFVFARRRVIFWL